MHDLLFSFTVGLGLTQREARELIVRFREFIPLPELETWEPLPEVDYDPS
jgi:hypothetical protein